MALPGGSGSVWMLIPTAIVLVIIIGGLTTGEVRFTRPKQPFTSPPFGDGRAVVFATETMWSWVLCL